MITYFMIKITTATINNKPTVPPTDPNMTASAWKQVFSNTIGIE